MCVCPLPLPTAGLCLFSAERQEVGTWVLANTSCIRAIDTTCFYLLHLMSLLERAPPGGRNSVGWENSPFSLTHFLSWCTWVEVGAYGWNWGWRRSVGVKIYPLQPQTSLSSYCLGHTCCLAVSEGWLGHWNRTLEFKPSLHHCENVDKFPDASQPLFLICKRELKGPTSLCSL